MVHTRLVKRPTQTVSSWMTMSVPQFINVIAMDVNSVLAAVESDKAGQPDSFEGMSVPATAANYPVHTPVPAQRQMSITTTPLRETT